MPITAFVLKEFCKIHLPSNCSDVLLSPDKMKAMKLIAKIYGLPFTLLLKKIDILSVNGYFRIKHILDKYCPDFLGCLKLLDLKERNWRRLYDDAGFFIKECFSAIAYLD